MISDEIWSMYESSYRSTGETNHSQELQAVTAHGWESYGLSGVHVGVTFLRNCEILQ